MSHHISNGFELKSVHHRSDWTCWSCEKDYDGHETAHHHWRIKDVAGRYWQTWLGGCPDCFRAWVNSVLLTTLAIQEYTDEHNTTEQLTEYLDEYYEGETV